MSLRSCLGDVQLIKAGPTVSERLVRWIAAGHRRSVIGRLQRFRESIEHQMFPQPWTDLRGPMLFALCDICAALGLTPEERAVVLGKEGESALAVALDTRWTAEV